jgi:L-ascorbate metabolism protein UlaG (beta-lactamase superfamily)
MLEIGGIRILTDPLLRDRVSLLRRHAPPVTLAATEPVDAVLVSHLHLDHLDLGSLRMVPGTPRLFVPRGGGRLLRRWGFDDVVELTLSDRAEFGSVSIEAVPAFHVGHRPPAGPRAESLGFVVESDEHRVWFAGDTDVFLGMANLRAIDLALLPVWGWGPRLGSGHLDPRRAAESLALVQPTLAIPIHWGTYWPIGLSWYRSRLLVDPPHALRSEAVVLAPDVEVRILEPGEITVLGPRRPVEQDSAR